jgi:hypothetical protein
MSTTLALPLPQLAAPRPQLASVGSGDDENGGHTRESSKIANEQEEGLICVNRQTWQLRPSAQSPLHLTTCVASGSTSPRHGRPHIFMWRLMTKRSRGVGAPGYCPGCGRNRTCNMPTHATSAFANSRSTSRRMLATTRSNEGGCPRVPAHSESGRRRSWRVRCALRARQQRH